MLKVEIPYQMRWQGLLNRALVRKNLLQIIRAVLLPIEGATIAEPVITQARTADVGAPQNVVKIAVASSTTASRNLSGKPCLFSRIMANKAATVVKCPPDTATRCTRPLFERTSSIPFATRSIRYPQAQPASNALPSLFSG